MTEKNPFLGGSGGTVGSGQWIEDKAYTTGSGVSTAPPRQVMKSVSELENLPDLMYSNGDIDGFTRLRDLVKNAGFSSWNEALTAAALDDSKTQRTWEDYLVARSKDPNIQSFLKAEERGRGGGGPTSSTSTSVNLSSETQAGAIADSNFRSELGRTASNDEIAGFQEALNAQQRKNPSVTNTTGFSSKGRSTSSSTSKGGFDYTRFARQYAQSQDGYAERFAGLKFMEILDSALADPNAIDALVAGE